MLWSESFRVEMEMVWKWKWWKWKWTYFHFGNGNGNGNGNCPKRRPFPFLDIYDICDSTHARAQPTHSHLIIIVIMSGCVCVRLLFLSRGFSMHLHGPNGLKRTRHGKAHVKVTYVSPDSRNILEQVNIEYDHLYPRKR